MGSWFTLINVDVKFINFLCLQVLHSIAVYTYTRLSNRWFAPYKPSLQNNIYTVLFITVLSFNWRLKSEHLAHNLFLIIKTWLFLQRRRGCLPCEQGRRLPEFCQPSWFVTVKFSGLGDNFICQTLSLLQAHTKCFDQQISDHFMHTNSTFKLNYKLIIKQACIA